MNTIVITTITPAVERLRDLRDLAAKSKRPATVSTGREADTQPGTEASCQQAL